jgi:hypothetical protein
MYDTVEYLTLFICIILSQQQSDLEGLTGSLRFGEDGRRENFTLSVVEMTVNSDIVKVSLFSYWVPIQQVDGCV